MDLKDAFQLVLDLAHGNVVDHRDNAEENARQVEALNTVEDFVTNQFGDD